MLWQTWLMALMLWQSSCFYVVAEQQKQQGGMCTLGCWLDIVEILTWVGLGSENSNLDTGCPVSGRKHPGRLGF